MPYAAGEAYSKTRKANTPKRDRQWRHVYESEKALGRSDGKAIRMASGVVKKQVRRDKAASLVKGAVQESIETPETTWGYSKKQIPTRLALGGMAVGNALLARASWNKGPDTLSKVTRGIHHVNTGMGAAFAVAPSRMEKATGEPVNWFTGKRPSNWPFKEKKAMLKEALPALGAIGKGLMSAVKSPGVGSRMAIGAGIGAAGGYLTKPEGSGGTGRALAGGALGALGGALASPNFRAGAGRAIAGKPSGRVFATGAISSTPHVAPAAATAPAIASLPVSRRIGEAIGRGAGHTMNAPGKALATGKAVRTNLVSGARTGLRQVRPLAPAPALEPHAFRGVGTPIGAPHAAPAAVAPAAAPVAAAPAAAPASVGTPIGGGKPSIMDRISGAASRMFGGKPQPAPPVFGQTHSVPPMRGIGGGVQVQPGTGVGESGPTRLAKPMVGAGFGSHQAASAKLKANADARFRQSAAYRSGMASGQ